MINGKVEHTKQGWRVTLKNGFVCWIGEYLWSTLPIGVPYWQAMAERLVEVCTMDPTSLFKDCVNKKKSLRVSRTIELEIGPLVWNDLVEKLVAALHAVGNQEERISQLTRLYIKTVEVIDTWSDEAILITAKDVDRFRESVLTEKPFQNESVGFVMTSVVSAMKGIREEISDAPWHCLSDDEEARIGMSLAVEASARFFENPRMVRNRYGLERYIITEERGGTPHAYTYEYCNACGEEILIQNRFGVQNCSKCGGNLLPCNYCGDVLFRPDHGHCKSCPLEARSPKEE